VSSLDFSTVLAIGIHDMKNSLALVLSTVDGLLESEAGSAPRDVEQLTKLRYEARRLSDNLVQLLTLFRTGRGLYQPRLAPQPVYELLEDYYLLNRPLFDHRHVSYEIDCDEALTWPLDRQLVISVLENVITNAVRYTRSRIRASATAADGWLRLRIEDDGPGFPSAMLGRRGADAEARLDPAAGRTGLGLYFCASIAPCTRPAAAAATSS